MSECIPFLLFLCNIVVYYAVRDCFCLCSAQAAERAGRYLAKSLGSHELGKEAEPFKYKDMGMLAYIGGYRALSNFQGLRTGGWLFAQLRLVFLY